MKRWRKLSLFGFLFLLLNSAYLISFGEPTLFYISNVLIHVVVGILLIIPFVSHLVGAFANMSIVGKSGMVCLVVGVVSGGYLMIVGATTPNRWLLTLHIATTTLGAVLFVAHLFILAKQPCASISLQNAAKSAGTILAISVPIFGFNLPAPEDNLPVFISRF